MKLNNPYIHVCNLNISEVKVNLPNINNYLWHEDTFRQELYKVHNQTLSIIFKWDSNNDGDKSFINKKVIDTQLGK